MKKLIYIFSVLCLACGFTACSDDDNIPASAPAPEASGTWTDDRDGSEYGWVRYGNLEWTTVNLNYESNDGTWLPQPITWGYDNGVGAKYREAFGLLYDHKAALAAVPDGWRLPSCDDWADLELRSNGDIKGAINLTLGGYYVNNDYFQQIHPDVDVYAYVYGFYWASDIDKSKPADSFAFYRKITFNQAGSVCDSMDKTNYMNARLVRDVK